MTNPPKKKTYQKDYIHSAIRFPPDLYEEIKADAEANGRSMNAEVLARVRPDRLDMVLGELAEIKIMMRKILDQM